jgi:hypothetical protein
LILFSLSLLVFSILFLGILVLIIHFVSLSCVCVCVCEKVNLSFVCWGFSQPQKKVYIFHQSFC